MVPPHLAAKSNALNINYSTLKTINSSKYNNMTNGEMGHIVKTCRFSYIKTYFFKKTNKPETSLCHKHILH